jgi:S1-C subfamily serine protease
VLDGEGRALGMAVRGPRGRTLVIPGETIERVASQLQEHGHVPIPYLGASLKDVPLKEGRSGAMVMTIDHDGPGATGGLQQGDIIIAWAGEPVPGAAATLRALRATPIGKAVSLGLRRGGTPLELAVTIGARPHK